MISASESSTIESEHPSLSTLKTTIPKKTINTESRKADLKATRKAKASSEEKMGKRSGRALFFAPKPVEDIEDESTSEDGEGMLEMFGAH